MLLRWFAAVSILWLGCARPAPHAQNRPSGHETGPAGILVQVAEIARAEGKRDFGVDRLAALASADHADVRVRALLGLGRVGAGNEKAVALLVGALDEPDARIRGAAARALGIAGAAQAENALIARYEREADSATRALIIEALGRVGQDAALSVLTAALAHDELAEHAAIAMGRFGRRQKPLDDLSRRALIAAAQSQRVALRHAVAFALLREHQPAPGAMADEIVAALDLRAQDPDPEVRALSLAALAKRKPGSPRLSLSLADPDWRVRVAAVRGLASAQASAEQHGELASHVLHEWAAFLEDDMQGPRIHVLTEGLRALASAPPAGDILRTVAWIHQSSGTLAGEARKGPDSGPDSRPDHRTDSRPDHRPERGSRLAASTIHCLAANLRVRAGASIDLALQCGGPLAGGMPEHERALLVAQLVAAGHGGAPDQRLARLRALFDHRDGRVRAAAASVLAELVSSADGPDLPGVLDVLTRGALDLLERALADPAVEVVGTAADAVRTLAADAKHLARVAPLAAGPLLARAGAEQGSIELTMTLLAALTAARVEQAAPLCQRAHAHANVSIREAGRACLEALAGPDPGPDAGTGRVVPGSGRKAAPMDLPPVDPAAVLGKKLVLTIATSKGGIDVALDSEAAPWHVASLLHLVEQGFYRDLLWHRVVPDFVVQGGDPLGSGWGGPSFVIPAEPSAGQFRRGTVGIADAGLDTGGSQWFIMHSRAPHLDGRYTIIGQVIRGQEVVDALIVGDRILSATVTQGR